MKSRVFHGVFFLVLTLAFAQLAGGAVVFRPGEKAKYVVPGEEEISGNAVELFAAVIRTAPYGKYTARAQFDIGLARQKQGANDAALQAYQAVIDKFPTDPVAADAQYQIGYVWMTSARGGTRDISATNNARTAFQDFLFRYPNSEKVPQARANLQMLERKTTGSSFDVARFYDKQKYYRAAVIYYNEVIRQQPGSAESEKAKKRIDQLRAKLGDKALESALEADQAERKKTADQNKAKTQGPKAHSLGAAPVLPSDLDDALPPPPSAADSTPSRSSASFPDSTPSPEPSSKPEESPTPEATASPPVEESPEAAASPTP